MIEFNKSKGSHITIQVSVFIDMFWWVFIFATQVIRGLLKFWPKICSQKEVSLIIFLKHYTKINLLYLSRFIPAVIWIMHKVSIFILRKLTWHAKECLKHGRSLGESCEIRVFTYLSVIRQHDRLLCRTWVVSLSLLQMQLPRLIHFKMCFWGKFADFIPFLVCCLFVDLEKGEKNRSESCMQMSDWEEMCPAYS